MGVIAIGASTEVILKHACEIVGITWKNNAKNTLHTYIIKYSQESLLDSKIKSKLEIIKEMRNRAAHDFNINWSEFKMTLEQFSEVVSWYSEILEKTN